MYARPYVYLNRYSSPGGRPVLGSTPCTLRRKASTCAGVPAIPGKFPDHDLAAASPDTAPEAARDVPGPLRALPEPEQTTPLEARHT